MTKYKLIPEFSQFVEYITQGDLVDGEYQVVVNHVNLAEQDIVPAAETLKSGYEHVDTLGRLPTINSTEIDDVKIKVAESYCSDVADYVGQATEIIPLLNNLIEVKSYADWVKNESVSFNDVRLYRVNGNLYRCAQPHTTQSDWTPDVALALWVKFHDPNSGTYPEWVQPTGAHDAYELGYKVTHNGHLWESSYTANVWEPGVFGWADLGVYP